MDLAELHAIFPCPPAPHGSNVILDYMPPRRSERLKNSNGEVWRPRAEKSVTLYCNLLARFSRAGDMVCDMFAGSWSLGLACMMMSRKCVACEQDPDLVVDARARVGKLAMLMQSRKEKALKFQSMKHTIPLVGLATSIDTPPIGSDNVPAEVAENVKEECKRLSVAAGKGEDNILLTNRNLLPRCA